MARKVVGVGSVGTRAWVFLLVGRDGKDPLVLQAKEAQASVLEPYLGASEFENHGERVVRGQRMAQAAIDVFLSWQRSQGLDGKEHDFYVRQLWDWKASIDLSTMSDSGLHAYTRACGWSLARAHARSGDRLAIAAYLGSGLELRPGDRPLLGGLRRSERARPPAAGRRRGRRRGGGSARRLTRAGLRSGRDRRRLDGPAVVGPGADAAVGHVDDVLGAGAQQQRGGDRAALARGADDGDRRAGIEPAGIVA